MELLRKEEQAQAYDVQTEAQRHNALISERYKRLQNTVASQLAEDVRTEEQAMTKTLEKTTYISPNTVNSSAYAQTPAVTEYISRATSEIFTPEKFDRMQLKEEAQVIAPPVEMPVQEVAAQKEAQYSLSSAAKIVMAAFAALTVAMLTLICVNTAAINQKRADIQILEERKAVLMEQNAELQQRIENATSDETIREYAESQGMVQTK